MDSPTPTQPSALARFLTNLRRLPSAAMEALTGPQYRPESDRDRSRAVFNNFFLHIHSVHTHRNSLKWSYSLGLGLFCAANFLVLLITGLLLMVYYKPSTELAYQSIKDIESVVFTGRFMRNVHRWSAHLMVIGVLAHMARVFYTGAHRAPRGFNWMIGLALFILTLALSFTGYLLPWDQLAYWAVTIAANIIQSPREITDAMGITPWFDPGGGMKRLLLGSNTVGEDALLRFYYLHVAILPILTMLLIAVHAWRIRKDGGLSRPGEDEERGRGQETGPSEGWQAGRGQETGPSGAWQPGPSRTYGLMALVRGKRPNVGRPVEETVPTWPHALYFEAAVLMLCVALCTVAALFWNAPLKEMANPAVPENPAKAPWYFLGLQELVSFSAFAGGVLVPAIAIIGLALIPFLDREKGGTGRWFGGPAGRRVAGQSLAFATVANVGLEFVCIRFGWLRDWFPAIPQLVITLVNPGTLLVAASVAWSLRVMRRTDSTQLGAIALFTCFLVGFVILTAIGTWFRGPNWDFYWSKDQWPVH